MERPAKKRPKKKSTDKITGREIIEIAFGFSIFLGLMYLVYAWTIKPTRDWEATQRKNPDWIPFEKRWVAEIETVAPRGFDPLFHVPLGYDGPTRLQKRPDRPELAQAKPQITAKVYVLYDFTQYITGRPLLRRGPDGGQTVRHTLNNDWLPETWRAEHPQEVGFVVMQRWKADETSGVGVWRFHVDAVVYDLARKDIIAEKWFEGPPPKIPDRVRIGAGWSFSGDCPIEEVEAWVIGMLRPEGPK